MSLGGCLLGGLYNHYNIPYEMFSLDTGNYKEVFNIDKDIPNNYTQFSPKLFKN